MDNRLIFDTIPEQFDKYRPRYCEEAFREMCSRARLAPGRSALEIGPGTGQATEPVLKTGCSYLAIELGANFTELMRKKFSRYANFRIVNADFETHDFGAETFDLVYSAATIQWILEKIGFSRANTLLKPGGSFAMMFTRIDIRSADEALYNEIQKVYKKYFHPGNPYTQRLVYENVVNYGFAPLETFEYHSERRMDADDYVSYIGTHCDHIALREPERASFFNGVRDAVASAGGITLRDAVVLRVTHKL